jgi:hypothetical protein
MLSHRLLRFHLDYSWQDEQYALANTGSGEVQVDDYGLLSGRISTADVEFLGGNWQFAASDVTIYFTNDPYEIIIAPCALILANS